MHDDTEKTVRRYINLKDGQPTPLKLTKLINDIESTVNNLGGRIRSRQVVALIVGFWKLYSEDE